MCTSDLRGRARRAILPLAAVLCAASACDDPMTVRYAPPNEGLRLFLIVDPDQPTQPLLVKHADDARTLSDVRVEISTADGRTVSSRVVPPERPEWERLPCHERYGTITGGREPRCLNLDFAVRKGESYRLSVMAEGVPTAVARFTVPGGFSLTSVEARGAPPGTQGLDAAWTASPGAYRFVVAVRPTTLAACVTIRSCERRWFAVTTATTLSTAVPEGELAGSAGPYFVDVYAMDRALYEYLTSGVSQEMFPVPPVQNVEGGRGAVGAWVRLSHRLP